MECIKIKVIDKDKGFEDFFIKGKDEIEIEQKLMDWFLECSNFENTKEFIQKSLNVKIEEVKHREENE